MSTIQSSAEHLTLNADGSSKDIKLQSNASEKVIVKSTGNVGIGITSPTSNLHIKSAGNTDQAYIQVEDSDGNKALRLLSTSSTGDNELIVYNTSGSGQVKLNSNGHSYFNNGNVGIGTTSPARKLHLKDTGFCALAVDGNASANSAGVLFYQNGVEKGHIIWDNTDNALQISGQASNETDLLKITSDGRGLSQFTAKAWVAWNQTGTIAIRDSHNVSSMSDYGTGEAKINLTNNMATADSYAVSALAAKASGAPSGTNSTFTTIGESLPVTGPVIGMIYNGSASDRPYASAIIFGD